MKMLVKKFFSENGRKKELKKVSKYLDGGILHFRSDFGQSFQVDFFRKIYFPESDYMICQVNINKHGVVFFWSNKTYLSYRFDFITKQYLGVL